MDKDHFGGFPAEPTENLAFGQALEALKQGKKVTRAVWQGYWFMARAVFNPIPAGVSSPEGAPVFAEQVIVAALRDGVTFAPAQPYQADLLAEDWKIID